MIIGSEEVNIISRALEVYATQFRQAALDSINNAGDLARAEKNRRIAMRVEEVRKEVMVAVRLHVVKAGDTVQT